MPNRKAPITAGETTMGRSMTVAKKWRQGKRNRDRAYPAGMPTSREMEQDTVEVQTVSQNRCHIRDWEKK